MATERQRIRRGIGVQAHAPASRCRQPDTKIGDRAIRQGDPTYKRALFELDCAAISLDDADWFLSNRELPLNTRKTWARVKLRSAAQCWHRARRLMQAS